MKGFRERQRDPKKIIAPGFKSRQLSRAELKLNRRGARRGKKHDMEIAQAAGFKNMNQMQAAMQRMTPEQRMQFQRKNEKRFAEIGTRNQAEFNTRNANLIERVRRQQRRRMQQNPIMPTAGMSQGRNATGRTPMPGPAPDSERMRRMQQLMREQQKRLNDARRRRLTEAERIAANDARRRPTRNTRRPDTPDIDDLLAAAKRASGRTGSGTLDARTKAAKDMNRIERQMRGLPPSGRPVGQPTGRRRRRPTRGRRR